MCSRGCARVFVKCGVVWQWETATGRARGLWMCVKYVACVCVCCALCVNARVSARATFGWRHHTPTNKNKKAGREGENESRGGRGLQDTRKHKPTKQKHKEQNEKQEERGRTGRDRRQATEARRNTEARGEMKNEKGTTIHQPRRAQPVRTRRRDSAHLVLSADAGARSQQQLNARRVTEAGSQVESSRSVLWHTRPQHVMTRQH